MHLLATRAAPALHGFVFPAQPGDQIQVQKRVGSTWTTVTSVRLDAHGAYSVGLSAHGTYRIVYRGLDGPAVSV